MYSFHLFYLCVCIFYISLHTWHDVIESIAQVHFLTYIFYNNIKMLRPFSVHSMVILFAWMVFLFINQSIICSIRLYLQYKALYIH